MTLKAKKSTVTLLRLLCLCLEIYKTINCRNPAFMTDIFSLSDSKKPVRKQNVLNLNPLGANFTKWSNTLKQFVGKLPTNCFSVFEHFVGLVLKGLM